MEEASRFKTFTLCSRNQREVVREKERERKTALGFSDNII